MGIDRRSERGFLIVCFSGVLLLGGCEEKSILSPGAGRSTLVAYVVPADETGVSEFDREAYLNDAGTLALRLLERGEWPGINEVELPSKLVRSLYNALLHIYNARYLPARQYVVGTYPVHTLDALKPRLLGVKINGSAVWPRQWLAGNRLTGYGPVDSLMVKYNLQLGGYSPYTLTQILATDRPLNTVALASRFSRFPGVETAHPAGSIVGDGNDIRLIALWPWIELEFKRGWGDCPAGCVYEHFGRFRVYPSGNVLTVASFGSPLPQGRR